MASIGVSLVEYSVILSMPVVLSSTQYACTHSVVLSMPVLSSPIGFLYLLALISSEPVAIGPPPVHTGNRCWLVLGPLGAPKWAPKWAQNQDLARNIRLFQAFSVSTRGHIFQDFSVKSRPRSKHSSFSCFHMCVCFLQFFESLFGKIKTSLETFVIPM